MFESKEMKSSKKIYEKSPEDLEKLTKPCLSSVRPIAERYQNQGLTLDDLICQGNVGLLCAAEHYDETSDHEFQLFAVPKIIQFIQEALSEHSKIKCSDYPTINHILNPSFNQNRFNCGHFSEFKTKITYFKVLEINENSVIVKVLINKEQRSFQKRRFDAEPFVKMNLKINDFVQITTSTIPGQRTFNYHKITGSTCGFDQTKSEELKSLFEKKDYFKGLEYSELFKPLPLEHEDNV